MFATTLGIQVFGPCLGGATPLGAFNLPIGAGVTSTDTRVGWTVGADIERKFAWNWSAKLEYLYMDLGSTANQADLSFHDHVLPAGFNDAFSPTPALRNTELCGAKQLQCSAISPGIVVSALGPPSWHP
ncbi:outer membrane protein [Bradyrhizobium diazoefficiens]|uniref:outer membrane protein n=1 Tax=Bradyrhizobium diazoefficiens TaxID=1355477 RepID=UPI0034E5C0F4